jgi:prefoldin alpha subunit
MESEGNVNGVEWLLKAREEQTARRARFNFFLQTHFGVTSTRIIVVHPEKAKTTPSIIHQEDTREHIAMSELQQQGTTYDLDSMSLEDLNQVKQQEEQRLQALTSRYAQLRSAAARLNASQNAVSALSPSSEGKDVMVPMTESVYVPGKIREPTKLLVELGTGFFAEKSSKDTTAYLDRKLRLVDQNSENVTKAIQVTRQNMEHIRVTMEGKMMEIRARQEGQRVRASAEAS